MQLFAIGETARGRIGSGLPRRPIEPTDQLVLVARSSPQVLATARAQRCPVIVAPRRSSTRRRSAASYRLKDFRLVATRYDRLAANFPSGVTLAAIVAF